MTKAWLESSACSVNRNGKPKKTRLTHQCNGESAEFVRTGQPRRPARFQLPPRPASLQDTHGTTSYAANQGVKFEDCVRTRNATHPRGCLGPGRSMTKGLCRKKRRAGSNDRVWKRPFFDQTSPELKLRKVVFWGIRAPGRKTNHRRKPISICTKESTAFPPFQSTPELLIHTPSEMGFLYGGAARNRPQAAATAAWRSVPKP
jgi:hypothetical protein